MSHPAPSNADLIRLTAARLPQEARNSLISSVLEANLMPFVPNAFSFPVANNFSAYPGPCFLITRYYCVNFSFNPH